MSVNQTDKLRKWQATHAKISAQYNGGVQTSFSENTTNKPLKWFREQK